MQCDEIITLYCGNL